MRGVNTEDDGKNSGRDEHEGSFAVQRMPLFEGWWLSGTLDEETARRWMS